MQLSEHISAFVDREFARETAFLAELVKVASDNPPGDCAPHAMRAKALLEGLGFSVEAHPVPRDLVQACGMSTATNLIVRHRFGDGPTLALNAHGDVVPPGLGWTHDPYGAQIEDGPHGPAMFGRGVAVSKSDFATYAFALLALQDAARAGGKFGGTIELHLTYDEEAGGEIGPRFLLDRGLTKPDFVIAAGFSYAIVTAHNGCLHLEVTVTGKQAHAAMPQTGVDALEAATGVLQALYASRPALTALRSRVAGITSPTLNVGLIQGGINTNVVPDRISFRLDRRMIPEESPGEVEVQLRKLIADAVRTRPGISVEIKQILLAFPLVPQPGWEKLAKAISGPAVSVLGVEVPVTGVPLYTDARHYAALGIPSVLYGAGPRTLLEANAHNADENLRLSDLRAATKIVALAAAEICGNQGSRGAGSPQRQKQVKPTHGGTMSNPWDDPRVKRGINAQLADWRKRVAAGEGRLGWKVAFGAPAIMETLKISAPLTGFLLRRNQLPSGGSVSLKGWSKPIAEPEIAVHMGKDLAAGADLATVAGAIGALGPAIELVDPVMNPQADNLEAVLASDIFQRNIVLGEPSKARAGGSVAGLVATIFRNGVDSGTTSDPEANTGKLIERVQHVANVLAAFGEKLATGDVIITGSVLPPVPLSASDQRFLFTLAPLGDVSINFSH